MKLSISLFLIEGIVFNLGFGCIAIIFTIYRLK